MNIPIVTNGATGGASSITSAKTWEESLGVFRYFGAAPEVSTVFYAPAGLTNPSGRLPWAVEFVTDAPTFEWLTKGVATSHRWMMEVDGNVVVPSTDGPGSDGGTYHIKVEFGFRAVRRIRLRLAGYAYFGGLKTGPTDSVTISPTPQGPRVIVIGDSWTEGVGSTTDTACNGYVQQLGKLMGWPDIWASGAGGTGFIAPGSGGRVKFRDRVTADVINRAPDLVIVFGGYNDLATSTAAEVGTEAGLLFAAIRAGLPTVKLIAAGPNRPSVPDAGGLLFRDAIQTALAGVTNTLFIDTLGGATVGNAWITGTGNRTTPAANGNADRLIGNASGTDLVHPNAEGHKVLAYNFAAALRAQLPVLTAA